MKTELKDISPTQKEIKIEIEADSIKPVYQKVAQNYARQAQVPGFRKGFAPVDVVKTRFKDQIFNDVLREILPDQVSQAIQENNLNPLREPEIHFEDVQTAKLDGSQSIELHIHVEVMPEIPAPEYKGLEGTRRVRPVEESEIDEVIDERRKTQSSLTPLDDHKAEDGDTIIVDLNGNFIDDDASEPIKAEDIEITLGDERIEKGFNDNLLGVEPDQTKTFTIEYPDDFSSPGLAGKKVEYTANIKAVGIIELPAADDEWAKSLEEGFESIKELRRKLRDDMEYVSKVEADNRVRSQLVDALVNKHEFEVPGALTDSQAKGLVNNFAQNMMGQGMDPNAANKDFWQMVYNQMLPQAERDVRGAMLLDKVAELEGVEVKPEEVEAEIELIAANSRTTVEEVRSHLEKHGGEQNVAERLRSRKAVEALLDHAKITDGEWMSDADLAAQEVAEATKAAEAAKSAEGPENTAENAAENTEETGKPKAKKAGKAEDKPKKAKTEEKDKSAAKKKEADDDAGNEPGNEAGSDGGKDPE
jgi:trigger factor